MHPAIPGLHFITWSELLLLLWGVLLAAAGSWVLYGGRRPVGQLTLPAATLLADIRSRHERHSIGLTVFTPYTGGTFYVPFRWRPGTDDPEARPLRTFAPISEALTELVDHGYLEIDRIQGTRDIYRLCR
jgi:hypothetical protein